MKQFDENELRKKIRSDLHKKYQEKQSPKNQEVEQSISGEQKLSEALKRRIRQIEEDRLFSQHPQFIQCENHLHETAWLTALEKAEQHEYFAIDETRWQRLKIKFTSSKTNIPQTPEIDEFRAIVVEKIEKDIESRLKKYQDLIVHYEHKKQKNRIDEIIEHEEQEFFKSHPDYNLYRNYIGNTRWLTNEEYEKEEEFTERVRTQKEKTIFYTGWAIFLLIVIASVYYLKMQFADDHEFGYLVISVNESRGQLYVDEKLQLGFTNNQAMTLAIGSHTITYRKDGFLTLPKIHNVNISLNDTSQLEFNLSARTSDSQGFVKIDARYPDSKLFVDDEFYGTVENNQKLLLDAGNHAIELKKDNFYITPSPDYIEVNAGDTIEIKFVFEAKSNVRRSTSSIKSGLIEISSNVKGAKILLNRKDSGHTTNYVFNNLPLTNYNISVEKDGYKSFPAEKEIKLSSKENHSKTSFNLTRTTMPVNLITRPVNGKIYVDDREVGVGKWSGSLPLGVHKIRFGDINFFNTPVESKFVITESGKTEFVFRYKSNFSIVFKPSGIKPDNVNAKIQQGYVNDEGQFISDSRNGPETRKSDILNEKIWWLSNAFNYRVPPANEAVAFSFYLPEQSEFGSDFSMKLWGYNGELSYPLELSGGCYFRIEVNNFEIHQKYEPNDVLTDAAENKFIRFPLGNVLHSGKNTIVISTAKINKTFFALWKIEIQ
jgi:PEGA domain-containing protein